MTTVSVLRPKLVLRGAHISNPNDPVWRQASMSFEGTEAWAGGLSVEGTGGLWTGERTATYKVATPTPLEMTLGKGRLVSGCNVSESNSDGEFRLSTESAFHFEATEPMSIAEIENYVVRPLRAFLAFAVNNSVGPANLALAGPKSDRFGRRRILRFVSVEPRPAVAGVEGVDPWTMLLPATRPQLGIGPIIERWFDLYAAHSTALDLMLARFLGEAHSPEVRLLLLAQAAEVYHRAARPMPSAVSGERASRAKLVIDSVPNDLREWVSGFVPREYSFQERIQLLADDFRLRSFEVLRDSFAESVAQTRHHLTHHGKPRKLVVTDTDELNALEEELRFVLTHAVLNDLGMDEEDLWTALRESGTGRRLQLRRDFAKHLKQART